MYAGDAPSYFSHTLLYPTFPTAPVLFIYPTFPYISITFIPPTSPHPLPHQVAPYTSHTPLYPLHPRILYIPFTLPLHSLYIPFIFPFIFPTYSLHFLHIVYFPTTLLPGRGYGWERGGCYVLYPVYDLLHFRIGYVVERRWAG